MAKPSKPTKSAKAPANVARPKQYKRLRDTGMSHETAKKIAGPKKGRM